MNSLRIQWSCSTSSSPCFPSTNLLLSSRHIKRQKKQMLHYCALVCIIYCSKLLPFKQEGLSLISILIVVLIGEAFVFHISKHYVQCIALLLEAQSSAHHYRLLEDTLPGSDHQRSFNTLEQFFNTVYTRDFLVQILFTQDKNNTGINYLSLISAMKESKPKSSGGFLSLKLTRRGLIKDIFAA